MHGLAECLKALNGKNHGESKESQKLGLEIVKHMRKKLDEFSENNNLNFVLYETHELQAREHLISLDKSIYGKIDGVTDREIYTLGFSLPYDYNSSIKEQIEIEAPYHKLTNGGHIMIIDIGSKSMGRDDIFEKYVKMMKEADVGLGKLIVG